MCFILLLSENKVFSQRTICATKLEREQKSYGKTWF